MLSLSCRCAPPMRSLLASRSFSTVGAPIVCKAAVARGVNDLRIEEITVAAPKAGEVRLKVHSNALCHTDIYVRRRSTGAATEHWRSTLQQYR